MLVIGIGCSLYRMDLGYNSTTMRHTLVVGLNIDSSMVSYSHNLMMTMKMMTTRAFYCMMIPIKYRIKIFCYLSSVAIRNSLIGNLPLIDCFDNSCTIEDWYKM